MNAERSKAHWRGVAFWKNRIPSRRATRYSEARDNGGRLHQLREGGQAARERLARALQAAGFTVWWDVEDLSSGLSFNRAIQLALEASKRVVVLWSGASIRSDYVEAEAYWAWKKRSSIRSSWATAWSCLCPSTQVMPATSRPGTARLTFPSSVA